MNHLDQFLQEVTLRFGAGADPAALGESLREMRMHLEDSCESFVNQGMTRDEAELAAIKAFGDPNPAIPARHKLLAWRLRRETWMAFAAMAVTILVFAIARAELFLVPGAMLILSGMVNKRIFMAPVTLVLVIFVLVTVPTDGCRHPWSLQMPRSADRENDLTNEKFVRSQDLIQRKAITEALERASQTGVYSIKFNGEIRYPKVILFGPTLTGYTYLATHGQYSPVKTVNGHPEWKASNFYSDEIVARLALAERIAFQRARQPLWEEGARQGLITLERRLYADPWGNFVDGPGKYLGFHLGAAGLLIGLQALGLLGRLVADLISRRSGGRYGRT